MSSGYYLRTEKQIFYYGQVLKRGIKICTNLHLLEVCTSIFFSFMIG